MGKHENTDLAEYKPVNGEVKVSLMSAAIDLFPQSRGGRIVLAIVAVVAALVSFFAIGGWASNPETYASVIASLDAESNTAMGFVSSSTGASALITLVPGDAGTPIAEKLLDIGADFTIVLVAIYLEKYLLTILGFVAFKVLVPVGFLFVLFATLLSGWGSRYRSLFVSSAIRLILLGVVLAAVVPLSVAASDAIRATYEFTNTQTLEAIEGDSPNAVDEQGSGAVSDEAATDVQYGSYNVVEAMTDGAVELRNMFNDLVEKLAVMIVTSCVIPLLVLFFLLWVVKTLLGLNVNVPTQLLMPRSLKGIQRRRLDEAESFE